MGGKGGGGMPNVNTMRYGGGRSSGGGSRQSSRAPEQPSIERIYEAYRLTYPDVKNHPYYGRNAGTAREHWQKHGRAEGREYDWNLLPPRERKAVQVSSGESSILGGTPRGPRGRGFNVNRSAAAKATGAAAGAAIGNFLLGPFGTSQGARMGYLSAQEGYIGDLFNTRRGETYRDYLERQGVSHKDVKRAGKYPMLLETAARDQGYTGTSLMDTSDWDEGEEYDSITGEIF